MEVHLLNEQADLERYGKWVLGHPQGNLWQALERKRYCEALGKETRIYVIEDNKQIRASAFVMIDRTTFGLRTWEIPRGPLTSDIGHRTSDIGTLLDAIVGDAKKDRCLSMYLSPPEALPEDLILNFQFSIFNSARSEQPEATRLIDLTKSEEEILAQMKPKGRYNIRVAEKHGIRVEQSKDIDIFYSLVCETGKRDRFSILSHNHYKTFLEELQNTFLLLAFAPNQQKPIAGLLGVVWNVKGIYYYGASSYAHRALMAPYLLQWEALRLCKRHGCTSYDLLGVAPSSSDENHPWAGITYFKEKFGGTLVTYPPEQQIVLRPVAQRALALKRKILG